MREDIAYEIEFIFQIYIFFWTVILIFEEVLLKYKNLQYC